MKFRIKKDCLSFFHFYFIFCLFIFGLFCFYGWFNLIKLALIDQRINITNLILIKKYPS